MSTLDSFSQDYLRLVLEIHSHHIDGFVDSYYGPEEIRAEAEASMAWQPSELLAKVIDLRGRIPAADPERAAYLTMALRGIECTIRMLNGESFDFLDEVYRIYDIQPQLVEESRFAKAHQKLDAVLPRGLHPDDLAGRLNSWKERFEIEAERALPLLELVGEETRRRTAILIDLPDDEGVELSIVKGQPWSAYNWYLGNGRSRIEFNTDMPLQVTGLLGTFAHEGYPGHHTEQLLKEISLYREKGYVEQAAMLLHSPAAVIAEGIATTALEFIFPEGTHYEWNVEVMLPSAGFPPEPDLADQLAAVGSVMKSLKYVSGNAAILYHTGQLNKEQTIDYLKTFALVTPERAARSFSFLSHPLYRSYVFTYSSGYDLISASEEPRTTFLHLLTHQALPSQLSRNTGFSIT